MYITLPLYSDSFYSYTANIKGVAYLFEFMWNSRQGCYHFDIYSEGRSPFSLGNSLVVQSYPIVWDDEGSALMCLPRHTLSDTLPIQEEVPDFFGLVFFER